MPTYQYQCAKCGETFEQWQSITDDAMKKHPGCGGKLTKVMGSVGIVLKGSGFYRTDNRSSSRSTAAKSDTSSSEGSSSSSSDSGSKSPDSKSPDSKGSDSKGSDSKGSSEGSSSSSNKSSEAKSA